MPPSSIVSGFNKSTDKLGIKAIKSMTAWLCCVGGPLGELVQWSDIMAALYILGHHIDVISEGQFPR